MATRPMEGGEDGSDKDVLGAFQVGTVVKLGYVDFDPEERACHPFLDASLRSVRGFVQQQGTLCVLFGKDGYVPDEYPVIMDEPTLKRRFHQEAMGYPSVFAISQPLLQRCMERKEWSFPSQEELLLVNKKTPANPSTPPVRVVERPRFMPPVRVVERPRFMPSAPVPEVASPATVQVPLARLGAHAEIVGTMNGVPSPATPQDHMRELENDLKAISDAFIALNSLLQRPPSEFRASLFRPYLVVLTTHKSALSKAHRADLVQMNARVVQLNNLQRGNPSVQAEYQAAGKSLNELLLLIPR